MFPQWHLPWINMAVHPVVMATDVVNRATQRTRGLGAIMSITQHANRGNLEDYKAESIADPKQPHLLRVEMPYGQSG